MPESDEQRLTAVFEVNEQFAKVPDASDPEIKIAPPYNGTTTKPDTHMPPSDVCKCLQDMNDDLRQYLK